MFRESKLIPKAAHRCSTSVYETSHEGRWHVGHEIWGNGDMGYGCWGYGIWGMRDEPIWASGQGGGWRGRNDISLLKLWLLRAYTLKGFGAPLAKCTRLADAECSVRAYTPTPPPSEPPDTSLVPWPCESSFPCDSMTNGPMPHVLSCSLYVLILQCIL